MFTLREQPHQLHADVKNTRPLLVRTVARIPTAVLRLASHFDIDAGGLRQQELLRGARDPNDSAADVTGRILCVSAEAASDAQIVAVDGLGEDEPGLTTLLCFDRDALAPEIPCALRPTSEVRLANGIA